jgi:transposase
MEKPCYLGIDISKKSFAVALKREEKYKHKSFSNEEKGYKELKEWLENNQVREVHCCMEATGIYGEKLAEYLYEQGYEVSVENPLKINAYGKSQLSRNKTDKADAKLIAQYCEERKPGLFTPMAKEVKEFKEIVRHLIELKEAKTQQTNRLEAVRSKIVIESVKAVVKTIEQEIEEVEKLIKKHIDNNPSLKADKELLKTIPGIGETTASLLMAEIPEIRDFTCAKKLAAFAGLSPKQHSSGTSVRKKSRICKIGNPRVRKALYFPAITAMRCNPIIMAFSKRLSAKGKHKFAVICACMRKLLHLAFGVLKSRLAFDPNFSLGSKTDEILKISSVS